jgi:serine O-acetyltransferase
MSLDFTIGDKLPGMVDILVASYHRESRIQHIDRAYLPSRSEIVELLERLIELMYPGFRGRQYLTAHNVAYHVGELRPRISEVTFRQITQCLCYQAELEEKASPTDGRPGDQARDLTMVFLNRLPAIRERLAGDVQAAYDGDPAALNTDEIILAYPGLLAVTVHRLAHELYLLDVPLMARIMSEWAHTHTGVDIHPGARIGRNFFIDHATGVVIGETTDIGDNVKLYQGVTLGALSFPKDERGRLIRGAKRHPTVEDHVTIYANAIILGGDTVIGKGAVIGGSVFITSSVPAGATVTFTPPELRIRDRGARGGRSSGAETAEARPDYYI